MWQTDISVDSSYNVGDNIERHLGRLGVTFVRANIKGRDVFSVASNEKSKRDRLTHLVSNTLLIDVKYRYFERECPNNEDITMLLLAEMLFFDSKYERGYIDRLLPLQYDYSIDGIVNFKMAELRENWDYLISLAHRVENSRDDMLLLINYIHDSAVESEKRVYMTRKNGNIIMFDVNSGEGVESIDIFNSDAMNTLYMIISAHISVIYVDKRYKFDVPCGMLEDVVSVKYV